MCSENEKLEECNLNSNLSYGGAVQGQQFVFETKFVLGSTGHPANIKGLVEQILEHPPGPISVGMGECGFVRGLFDP
jgi:hypothetical protein